VYDVRSDGAVLIDNGLRHPVRASSVGAREREHRKKVGAALGVAHERRGHAVRA
jgi:hypothetical protein